MWHLGKSTKINAKIIPLTEEITLWIKKKITLKMKYWIDLYKIRISLNPILTKTTNKNK